MGSVGSSGCSSNGEGPVKVIFGAQSEVSELVVEFALLGE